MERITTNDLRGTLATLRAEGRNVWALERGKANGTWIVEADEAKCPTAPGGDLDCIASDRNTMAPAREALARMGHRNQDEQAQHGTLLFDGLDTPSGMSADPPLSQPAKRFLSSL